MKKLMLIAFATSLLAQLPGNAKREFADRKQQYAESQAKVKQLELELGRQTMVSKALGDSLEVMRSQWTKACVAEGKKFVESPDLECR